VFVPDKKSIFALTQKHDEEEAAQQQSTSVDDDCSADNDVDGGSEFGSDAVDVTVTADNADLEPNLHFRDS